MVLWPGAGQHPAMETSNDRALDAAARGSVETYLSNKWHGVTADPNPPPAPVITKVFEGPYRHAKDWHAEMAALARDKGATGEEVYFFYTTCPRCAKAYGKNYVVGVAKTG